MHFQPFLKLNPVAFYMHFAAGFALPGRALLIHNFVVASNRIVLPTISLVDRVSGYFFLPREITHILLMPVLVSPKLDTAGHIVSHRGQIGAARRPPPWGLLGTAVLGPRRP